MQLADFKAYYAEDGRIVWENVATLHEEVRIFRSAFVPMMSCMQVIRLLRTTIAEQI